MCVLKGSKSEVFMKTSLPFTGLPFSSNVKKVITFPVPIDIDCEGFYSIYIKFCDGCFVLKGDITRQFVSVPIKSSLLKVFCNSSLGDPVFHFIYADVPP